jgi:hypothetical protein
VTFISKQGCIISMNFSRMCVSVDEPLSITVQSSAGSGRLSTRGLSGTRRS